MGRSWVLELENAGNAWLVVIMQMPVVGGGPLSREREPRWWVVGGVGVDITVPCINHWLGIRPASLSCNKSPSDKQQHNPDIRHQTILEISTLACCHTSDNTNEGGNLNLKPLKTLDIILYVVTWHFSFISLLGASRKHSGLLRSGLLKPKLVNDSESVYD